MRTTKHYRRIVERFDDIARASRGEPRNIALVCATLAVNQRTLARAVRAVHGTTPARRLDAIALAEARLALLDPATRSVQQVALRCGFRELGRFAAKYRAAFDEYPSQTLRQKKSAALDDADRAAALCSRR